MACKLASPGTHQGVPGFLAARPPTRSKTAYGYLGRRLPCCDRPWKPERSDSLVILDSSTRHGSLPNCILPALGEGHRPPRRLYDAHWAIRSLYLMEPLANDVISWWAPRQPDSSREARPRAKIPSRIDSASTGLIGSQRCFHVSRNTRSQWACWLEGFLFNLEACRARVASASCATIGLHLAISQVQECRTILRAQNVNRALFRRCATIGSA